MEWQRSGAQATPAQRARQDAHRVAARVWQLAAPGFGPSGAWKLVGDELVRGGAVLGHVPGVHAAPYRSLVAEVARHGGHSALAAMLCARTVTRALDAPGRLPQRLQGVVLARRQLLAWLDAQATRRSPWDALRSVAGESNAWIAGLAELGARPDLDLIDVRPGHVDAPAWSPGLVLEPKGVPTAREVRGAIAVVGDLRPPARQAPTLRTSDAGRLAAMEKAEAAAGRRLVDDAAAQDVAVVICARGDEDTAQRLAQRGILVVTDAPASLARRVALATGARPVARLHDVEGALGHGHAVRRGVRRGGWLLAGEGAAATLEVPAGPLEQMRVGEAEGWLRAAAPVLDDPRVLPGAGTWQREAAGALRRAADHAPGAAPLGIRAVAAALDDIAAALADNAGRDSSRAGAMAQAAEVMDALACVRPAVAGALEAAIQVLRIDGAYAKRPSAATDLRGGTGPIGSPRGMPGDVPPLM